MTEFSVVMKAMYYDDGLDFIAPPQPDVECPGLVEDATSMWWIMPLAMLASTGVTVLIIICVFRLLK